MQLLLRDSRHFSRKVCIYSAFPIFRGMTLWTMIGFTDLGKCAVVLSNLASPASWCRATRAEPANWPFHTTCMPTDSPHTEAAEEAGIIPFSLYLFTQFLLHIYSQYLQGKVLVLCKSLSHIHSYGNVVIQLSTWSLPSAVTSSFDRGWNLIRQGPRSNLDGIKLLWSRQYVFMPWVDAIPQTSSVTYRLR